MAGLIDPNDIAKARQSGYSDTEISTFLADKHPDQFKAAKAAGYSDSEILSHLAPTTPEPSGPGAGFAHGVAGVFGGPASTIGLTGAPTDTLDAIKNSAEPANYQPAPIFDKAGFHPGNIAQSLAEAAPGLTTDILAGKTGAMVGNKVGGVRGGVVGGLGGFLGSAFLRNFGPGAHENADARTGVPNSPVAMQDMTREVGKQGLEAVPNMLLGGRFVPGVAKSLAESALAKIGTTAAVGGGVGATNDLINQVGTTAGSKDGVKYDWHGGANAATTGALLNTALASPRAAADVAGNIKYGGIESDPENRAAATLVANRNVEAADGRKLNSAATSQDVKDNVSADIRKELSASAKGESNLSQGTSNTLARIQQGGTASPTELNALSNEASPETASLARQALLSSQTKALGGLSDGSLSGPMDKLGIMRPGVAATALAAAATGAHLGLAASVPALGAVYGAYGLARGIDKLTGARSPVQGFTNRFADANVPIRAPEAVPAQPAPVSTSVPQIAPPQDTQLWGAPKPEAPSIDANAQNADIQGMLRMAAARRNVAAEQQAAAAPPAPAPAAPAIDPNLLPRSITGPARNITRGFKNSARAQEVFNIATRKAEGTAQAEGLAANSPAINDQGGLSALSNPEFTKRGSQLLSAANVMKKLTAQPAEVSDAPASPEIAAAMQTVAAHAAPQGQAAPTANAAPPGAPAPFSALMQRLHDSGAITAPSAENTAPIFAPPEPPMIAKISKKLGKPVQETPHPEEAFAKGYTPMDKEQLWGKGMPDKQFAQADAAKKSNLKDPEAYMEGIVRDRTKRRGILASIAGEGHDADQTHIADLLEELHHTRRADKANGAIGHFTAKMSPGMRAAVRKRMDKSFINSMWST
jgi:hypothetical protein